jgi:uncharacterized membrane protein
MSRPILILVLIVVAIAALLVWLANVNTEVVPVAVEKAMLNEAAPK